MYDHAPTTLCVEMVALPGNSACTDVEIIVKGYHTYQSVWVDVCEKRGELIPRINLQLATVVKAEFFVDHVLENAFIVCLLLNFSLRMAQKHTKG